MSAPTAGRHLAIERGAFDKPEPETAPEPEPEPVRKSKEPIWKCARMDSETFAYLADICGCTTDEFNDRYER
jgi:hypothetical protein